MPSGYIRLSFELSSFRKHESVWPNGNHNIIQIKFLFFITFDENGRVLHSAVFLEKQNDEFFNSCKELHPLQIESERRILDSFAFYVWFFHQRLENEIPKTSLSKVEKRLEAQKILSSSKSDDLKLFEIFEIYKYDLQNEYINLYYALLGWKDAHLQELFKEQKGNN